MSEKALRVEIYNQVYSIRSDGDDGYIQELAKYVDTKMREISSGTQTVDSLKVAILAALHIADEYHRIYDERQKIDDDLGVRSGRCAEMLDSLLKHREMPAHEILTEQ
ncbi:MAG: cell division protein ZapA [Chloracidobacterium sp.]|nr:cell division protein ZapA [Chloracidobacterium sp.]MCC6824277.1 cell division protein ZapA [Acidobacteriota bacterium]MCO5334534.1 cell division protein ZapA [Pyrinomonadaceae bacterium]